jgi:hypothetical protein
MAKSKIKKLDDRAERLKEELKKVREAKSQEKSKLREAERRMENHAMYIVAGFVLEAARGDANSRVWSRVEEIIADETTKDYDKRSLEVLMRRRRGTVESSRSR